MILTVPSKRSPKNIRWEIANKGYVHVPPDWCRGHRESKLFGSFSRFWRNLPLDVFTNGATYRRRRFGHFIHDPVADTLMPQGNGIFFQAAEVNRFMGGVERRFAPLEPDFVNHPLFGLLVRWCAGVLPIREPVHSWSVDVHVVRIIGHKDEPGHPTPEGIHRDGRDYVAMFLIARSPDSVGGESGIYDAKGRCLFTKTLRQRLEVVLVDDRRVLHGASPLYAGGSATTVTRDMLFLTYAAKGGS